MVRVIYKCKRKSCKAIRRIEYPQMEVVHLGYGRTERRYFRLDDKRGRVREGYDGVCACGGQCVSARIKGIVSEHVCDARCSSATGPNCECQCGGRNHGKDHEMAAAA